MGLISSVLYDVGYLPSLKILFTSNCNASKKLWSSRHVLRTSFFIVSTLDALEFLSLSFQDKISFFVKGQLSISFIVSKSVLSFLV